MPALSGRLASFRLAGEAHAFSTSSHNEQSAAFIDVSTISR